KGEFAQAVLERLVVELDHALEGLARGQERDLGAAPALGRAGDRERRDRVAVAELHEMLLAVAPDAQAKPARERVHDRDADAVQPARDLVGVLVELTPGME